MQAGWTGPFRGTTPRPGARGRRLVRALAGRGRSSRRGRRLPQAGQGHGRGRLAALRGRRRSWRRLGRRVARVDSRSVCILRETLARHEGLADFAFAMQGLGSGAISLMGSDALRARYLPRVARGEPSPPSRCPNPRPVPTWPRWPAKPGWTATPMCSTAPRPGSPTAASPTSTACSRAPARRRARAASAPLSWTPTPRASRSASAST